jgi:hypothetical protein
LHAKTMDVLAGAIADSFPHILPLPLGGEGWGEGVMSQLI